MIATRNHNKGPHSLFAADHVMICTKQAVLSLFFRKSFNNKNNQAGMKKKTNTAIKQDNNNEPPPHHHVHTQTHIQSKQSELALILVVLDHDQSASCCVVPDMSTPETTQLTTTSTAKAKATRNHKKHIDPTPTHVERLEG